VLKEGGLFRSLLRTGEASGRAASHTSSLAEVDWLTPQAGLRQATPASRSVVVRFPPWVVEPGLLTTQGHPACARRESAREVRPSLHIVYTYRKGLCSLLLQKYARMITLASAA
jgi:hypothetical protein